MDRKPMWLAVRILALVFSLTLVTLYIIYQSRQTNPSAVQTEVAQQPANTEDTTELKVDQPNTEEWVFPGSKSGPVKLETLPGSKSMIVDALFDDEPVDTNESEPVSETNE